ncbi:MAG: orotidine-5'-phosphate decarboxylase [Patescibacteria group bacterium]
MLKKGLIVGLDVPTIGQATEVVEETHEVADGFKIGFQLIYTMLNLMLGARDEEEAIKNLREARALFGFLPGKVFLDAKLHDISNTVLQALLQILGMNVAMVNMHALGGKRMMLKAKEAIAQVFGDAEVSADNRPGILAVTILTDHDYESLVDLGLFAPLPALADDTPENVKSALQRLKTEAMLAQVGRLALLAKSAGLDGVIASPKETAMIRELCGPDFFIGNPGIRSLWSLVEGDDQKRVTTPKQAIENGADAVIVSRPVVKKTAGMTRRQACERIKEEMASAA